MERVFLWPWENNRFSIQFFLEVKRKGKITRTVLDTIFHLRFTPKKNHSN